MPNRGLDLRRDGRKRIVRRRRRDDQQIDVLAFKAGLGERGARRMGRQRRGALVLRRDVPAA